MLWTGSAVAVVALLQQPGALGGSLAGVSLFCGVLYTGLLNLAGQSQQVPAVAVGAPLPDFTAPDENGAPFAIADLRGHPVLIKFFRGHW
jgi:cytochrome oxidase Cu insertion factor (SCO1/SenC/PrrC family)